jgi:hypothetical protein
VFGHRQVAIDQLLPHPFSLRIAGGKLSVTVLQRNQMGVFTVFSPYR